MYQVLSCFTITEIQNQINSLASTGYELMGPVSISPRGYYFATLKKIS